MDHNFPAALRGECPGVTPEEVFALKVAEVAKTFSISDRQVLDKVEYYQNELNELESQPERKVRIGDEHVIDMSHLILEHGYSFELLTAQMAVARSRKVALLCNYERVGGRLRLMLYGKANPETFQAFRKVYAPAKGYIENIYGVDKREYSGAHKPIHVKSHLVVASE
jgi:hypothetical protein